MLALPPRVPSFIPSRVRAGRQHPRHLLERPSQVGMHVCIGVFRICRMRPQTQIIMSMIAMARKAQAAAEAAKAKGKHHQNQKLFSECSGASSILGRVQAGHLTSSASSGKAVTNGNARLHRRPPLPQKGEIFCSRRRSQEVLPQELRIFSRRISAERVLHES